MSDLPAAITDPVSANRWSDYVRDKVTSGFDSSEIVTPDQIIGALRMVSQAAGRMVLVVRDADEVRRSAARDRARAEAAAQMQVRGEAVEAKFTVDEKSARVVELTADAVQVSDAAEVAYQYARSVARLVDEQKSAVQTMARMVELTFSLAGRRGGE